MDKLLALLLASALAYIILMAFTWLTPPSVFIAFLRVYLTIVNTTLFAFVTWAIVSLKRRPRPVPLPELERRFEKELNELMKEWKEAEKK